MMAKKKGRTQFFSFRCNKQDLAYLDHVAKELQRTRSDAIRFIIRKTVADMMDEKWKENG